MTITIYKDVLYRRMQSLHLDAGKNNTLPTLSALTALELAAQKIDAGKAIKPIKRPKGSSTLLSLYQIGGVSQVKAAKLGVGAFARTYLHVDDLPNQPGETDADHIYAVKVFRTKGDSYKQDVVHEVELLKKLDRLIRYEVRDGNNGDKKHYIDTKYFRGYTLAEMLGVHVDPVVAPKMTFTPEVALNLMIGVCEQVQTIHGLEYTHADLNLKNIIITPELKPIAIDFNYSRPFGQLYHYGFDRKGAPGIKVDEYRHVAPECCGKEYIQFTVASDVYAIGYLLGKILGNTSCNTATKEAIQSYIDDMRVNKPGDRPDLGTVIKSLRALLADPAHAQVSRRRVNSAMKNNVIVALTCYATNLGSYYCALVDTEHSQKSTFISGLIKQLTDISIRADFLYTLKEGFIHYFNRFVANNLEKYAALPDLGSGLACLISAINACGIEMDIPALIKEVEQNIPKNSPSAVAFTHRLTTVLSPRSLNTRPLKVKCA